MKHYGQKLVAMAVALSLVSATTAQAENLCMTSDEVKADKIRFVDVQLRVAALQCRTSDVYNLSPLYKAFVKENMPHLVNTQGPLKAWLKRSGRGSLDQYMVAAANHISLLSIKASKFCERAHFAAEYASKTHAPLTLLPLLPIQYRSSDSDCTSSEYAMGR